MTEAIQEINAEIRPRKMIVGFWFRFLSDFLDVLVLGAIGFAVAFLFRGFVYQLGMRGWWIGLIITFCYTGILHSAIGNGQTLAKKLLRIQVLRMDGTYLPLSAAFLRYAVIAFIAYNQWVGAGLAAALPDLMSTPVAKTLYLWFVLASFAGVAFLVPFHPLKQGVHDLLVGSIVVRKGSFSSERLGGLNDPSKAKRAYLLAGILGFCLIGGISWMSGSVSKMFSDQEWKQLISAQKSIVDSTALKDVGIQKFTSWGEKKATVLNLSGFLFKSQWDDPGTRESEARKAVEVAIREFPGVKECDYINVGVMTGFNIGIVSMTVGQGFKFSTDGKLLEKSPAPGGA